MKNRWENFLTVHKTTVLRVTNDHRNQVTKHSTMTRKPLCLSSLLPLFLLFLSPLPSFAVPSYVDAQAEFSQKPFLGMSEDKFEGMAMGWMDDAEKAILKGKENLEIWNYKGKEYIKQDNLLCENHLFANVLGADIR